ncbi:Oidioi.mRNA.OKI2018_I69.XSR.g13358.t1.cds [Oikopleura dioica]|uniref:Oidioi.mRNA.OKI2018_I69.XSR.g13358.t1.cds n=1 Tax=Oikopleura dioica TaxID=34765 RepID=A0ABN7S8D3_OIKDI|nr:Oidioi.mRNA.OKI2018_I69.XSR.g13358.t1.cds [Oikopleura dioica]
MAGDNNDSSFPLPGNSMSGGQLDQQQVLAQMDMDGIQRQAEEMAQLEADIMDVNIIFKDLNEMVMDQGTTLDTIEDNVGAAVMDVQEGNKKLEKAVDYARKARNKKICLIVTILDTRFQG